MRKLIGLAVPCVLALAAAPADARVYYYHGVVCQPAQASQGCIEYSQYGVHNTCTSVATIDCPLPSSYINAPQVSQIGITAYDRSTTTDVDCFAEKDGTDGNIIYNAETKTSGSSAFVMNPSAVAPNITQISGIWHIRCFLPAKTSSGSFSHLVSIFKQTSE